MGRYMRRKGYNTGYGRRCLDGDLFSNISLLGCDNRRYRYNVGYGGI